MKSDESDAVEHTERKDCGCVISVFSSGRQAYEPCLPHALDHAGKMLCAAGAQLARQTPVVRGPRATPRPNGGGMGVFGAKAEGEIKNP